MPIRHHIVHEIGVHCRTGIHSRHTRIGCWLVACNFEGFPRTLEKQTMLGIHQLRIARGVAKKLGVKALGIIEQRAGFDIIGRGVDCIVKSAVFKLFVTKERDGLHTFGQIFPKGVKIIRSGESARHANDRDILTAMTLLASCLGAGNAFFRRRFGVVFAAELLHQSFDTGIFK